MERGFVLHTLILKFRRERMSQELVLVTTPNVRSLRIKARTYETYEMHDVL